MIIDNRRIQKQNEYQYQNGPILYWMNRDMRLQDNWALIYAYELSKKFKTELVICYNLNPNFLGGAYRQFHFKIGSLKQLHQDSKEKNIAFYTFIDFDIDCVIDFVKDNKVGYIVTDFSPLKIHKTWLKKIKKNFKIPIDVVDTHNIVPVWYTSDKKEFAAYTIRPKIQKNLKEFLTDFPKFKKQKNKSIPFQKINFGEILHDVKINRDILPVDWCMPGEKSALKVLKKFIQNSDTYSRDRNNPNIDVQSQLSPYLHYGMIAPQRVAYEVLHSNMKHDSKKDFLEELIVRRELADNFCYYESNYDTSEGFHDYFKKELKKNEKFQREYLYTKEEFEKGKTHDDLWNACQMQLIKTGKMHGYMRMYWAKMIYAWSKNADEALKIAIYLNDTYELDGRDPNGYAGIAWCIGGVHDRPWYVINKVFGKLRYMSRSGMEKKFDVEKYINTWI